MGTVDYLAHLRIGEAYERPKLASLWGLAGFQAISRGVFTPVKTNLIFLFVTRVKQSCLTQYQDFLCDGILQWEGESRHANDLRIVKASLNEDEIHLFYREQHHMPFTFHGRVILVTFTPHVERPSEFAFEVVSSASLETDEQPSFIHEEVAEYSVASNSALNGIDRRILSKTRGLAQTVFRSNQLKLWDGACAVTGVREQRVLRASHIKPWNESATDEKVDRNNGLLLIPDLDALFDKGLITFQLNGAMDLSPSFDSTDQQKMHIEQAFRLRHVSAEMQPYLEYHREHRFVC